MIAVKGPELLAKFIGQSEENVRNVFERQATEEFQNYLAFLKIFFYNFQSAKRKTVCFVL